MGKMTLMGIQTLDKSTDADARDPRSDGVLLEQFTGGRNQEAFAQLLQRHGPHILGVCRRVTSHAQDAEDVFQACFLELGRKGAAISRNDSVAGWLQTVAVRLARKAQTRRKAGRLDGGEQSARTDPPADRRLAVITRAAS
jgi:RNA polymerase sigma-70 factor (ECF subfamily)